MRRFVIVRHGESEFNAQNRFTGWVDCGLTRKGVDEARRAGHILRELEFHFDRIYTSVLARCTKSARIIRSELGTLSLPIVTSWRLNERHYGALQGLNKDETAAQFGEKQVRLWRRGYSERPPALPPEDPRNPANDPKYAEVSPTELPLTESLADTVRRVVPYWNDEIAPAIRHGSRVLIVAHGNSIRALMKFLDDISDEDIIDLFIPTGVPLAYECSDDLRPLRHYYVEAAGGADATPSPHRTR